MIDIVPAEGTNFREVSAILQKTPYHPYRNLPDVREKVIRMLEDDIERRLERGTRGFVEIESGRAEAFALLEPLPWDSKIFGKRMGTISHFEVNSEASPKAGECLIKSVIDDAAKTGYEFLLAKTLTDNIRVIHLLEGEGFKLMDTLLCYMWEKNSKFPIPESPEGQGGFRVSIAQTSEEGELREVARRAFYGHFGRYHSDPVFSRKQATMVYEEWISSSFRDYADFFLVARFEGEIAGFCTWKKPWPLEQEHGLSIGHLPIAGVDPRFGGRGLFSTFLREGMRLLQGSVERIDTFTHINNYPFQRGCEKQGWKIADARHSFHKWLGGSG